jgi:hypothetical protein
MHCHRGRRLTRLNRSVVRCIAYARGRSSGLPLIDPFLFLSVEFMLALFLLFNALVLTRRVVGVRGNFLAGASRAGR